VVPSLSVIFTIRSKFPEVSCQCEISGKFTTVRNVEDTAIMLCAYIDIFTFMCRVKRAGVT